MEVTKGKSRNIKEKITKTNPYYQKTGNGYREASGQDDDDIIPEGSQMEERSM
jgi:hypothetical protein